MSDPAPQEQDATSKEQDATNKTNRRPGPQPPLPSIDKLYCSKQICIEDINIHVFDISNGKHGLCGYLGTLSAMKYRQFTWAPIVVSGIPVTPIENPKTKFSSLFIIRLIDSKKPWKNKVDLLIRDSDLYFVGFRREVVLEPGEEAQSDTEDEKKKYRKMNRKETLKAEKKESKKTIKPGWGRWRKFHGEGVDLPDFFDAIRCPVSASYGLAEETAGGWQTFEEIRTVLGEFEDGFISEDRLQKACYSVMIMICEASRLRSVFVEVVLRLVHNHARSTLNKELTTNISNWKQMGACVLLARLNGHMGFDEVLDKGFKEKFARVEERKHKIEVLGDLIDKHQGEVMLIKYDVEHFGYTTDEVERIGIRAEHLPTGGPAGRKELDFYHEL